MADNTDEAAAAQRSLNDAVKESTEYLEGDLSAIENVNKKAIADAKLRGASIVEISRLEGEAGNLRLRRIAEAQTRAAAALNDEKIRNNSSKEDYTKLKDLKIQLRQTV